MSKQPCPSCPFRTDSPLSYDADAYEALEAGHEPACHAVVGLEGIFAYSGLFPSESAVCIGFRRWMIDYPGYATPALSAESEYSETE